MHGMPLGHHEHDGRRGIVPMHRELRSRERVHVGLAVRLQYLCGWNVSASGYPSKHKLAEQKDAYQWAHGRGAIRRQQRRTRGRARCPRHQRSDQLGGLHQPSVDGRACILGHGTLRRRQRRRAHRPGRCACRHRLHQSSFEYALARLTPLRGSRAERQAEHGTHVELHAGGELIRGRAQVATV